MLFCPAHRIVEPVWIIHIHDMPARFIRIHHMPVIWSHPQSPDAGHTEGYEILYSGMQQHADCDGAACP